MDFDYDEECIQNKARNTALLRSLGSALVIPVPVTAPKKTRAPKKRKAAPSESDADRETTKPAKARRVAESTEKDTIPETTGLRKSERNRGKKVDYRLDHVQEIKTALHSGLREMKNEPRSINRRRHEPKAFGAIPGIPVGTWWLSREECSIDAVHAPWVAGIAGGPHGAYSVALSGGYEDDVDLGEVFTYTGAGGRDLKGTKNKPKNLRTAPQSSHQSFDNPLNRALQISSQTKKPIRVIRGYKLKSPYAPAEGYRYDGLYTVEKAWMEKGLNRGGWEVCKFAFKRVPGQAPLKLDGEYTSSEEDGPDAE